MTLVERFIDFTEWPTSRKTARYMAVLGPAHLPVAAFVILLRPAALDEVMIARILVAGFVVCTFVAAVSWIADRKGIPGRWTGYLAVLAYASWVFVLVVAFGVYSTPFLAFPFALPLFVILWYDAWLGAFTLVYGFVISVIAWWLTAADLLPFAPAMELRQIDEIRSNQWFAFVFIVLTFGTFSTYLIGIVVVQALHLQRRKLSEAHGRLELAHRLIRRYVPEQVADAVLSDTPEIVARHERRKLTIFFSDLVGFTDLSEELEPEDLATVLNDYFTEMSAIARKYGGTVDDLIGDAVLVLFGAPDFTDDRDQALRAVRMAVEMQEAMGPLNRRWASAGIPETLDVRMGINTGVATIGNFGSAERTKYTALGKQVNIAARIQAQCQPGKVLMGHATWLLVHDEIECIPKGELELKGLRKPMLAYEVTP